MARINDPILMARINDPILMARINDPILMARILALLPAPARPATSPKPPPAS